MDLDNEGRFRYRLLNVKERCVAVLVMLAALAGACMWDRDTAAVEARGSMEFVRVITGRFERNPPLYYQMRLARVRRELLANPRQLDLYDDAAVAADRLGDDDLALSLMARKREELERTDGADNFENWYRYYANAGTFHAHRWLRSRPASREEIKLGADMIAKAIKINPDAHFGREAVQLLVLRWIIDQPKDYDGTPQSLGDYILKRAPNQPVSRTLNGLAGLVALGNAWNSPDTFQAMCGLLSYMRRSSIAQFADLRAKELIAGGAKTLVAHDPNEDPYSVGRPDALVVKFNDDEFRRLRREADEWHRKRESFMLTRLKQGRHPDVDNNFWSGYVEPPAPEVREQGFWSSPRSRDVWIYASIAGVLLVLVGLPALLILHLVRRARARGLSANT